MLKDAEAEMARARRSHVKELSHISELSAQKEKLADLAGCARAVGERNT